MVADPTRAHIVNDLSDEEVDALVGAAAWYAKYHEGNVAAIAGDNSALAEARRRRFQNLHAALTKLGVRLRRPAGITPV